MTMLDPIAFYLPQEFDASAVVTKRLVPAAEWLVGTVVRHVGRRPKRIAVPLLSKLLEQQLGRNYVHIRKALHDSSDLLRVGGYSPRRHSYHYQLGRHHESKGLRRHEITDRVQCRRIRAAWQRVRERQRQRLRPVHRKWIAWQETLGVDLQRARQALQRIPSHSNPYGIQDMLIDRIVRGEHRFTVDSCGRCHNSISSLHRTLRPALTIDSQPIVQIDIVASQPTFLMGLLRKARQTSNLKSAEHNGMYLLHSLSACIDSFLLSPPPEDSDSFNDSGFFEAITSGNLYETLMRDTGLSREQVKRGLLRDVFGMRRYYPSPVRSSFERRFPETLRFIDQYKQDDHARLLRDLQRIESDVVIRSFGSRWSSPALSLHDCVLVPESKADEAEQMLVALCHEAGVPVRCTRE